MGKSSALAVGIGAGVGKATDLSAGLGGDKRSPNEIDVEEGFEVAMGFGLGTAIAIVAADWVVFTGVAETV
ncbi:hypothetical protein K9N68_22585 [Kovacikia minuta CCNUW1]|uniref:hypothetical protein n=1 Tax=Kovacikia minuta TaxID=2931930 RepID=UPI001CCB4833|nr:hypothetical protein [Kovacikia minuta]UBF24461.1 hypothetical protein K9N68_22585 [Kovacikia minuta CCNUW1]